MLKVEELYAMNDESISKKFNDLRNNLSSTDFGNEDNPIVKFNKEISTLEKNIQRLDNYFLNIWQIIIIQKVKLNLLMI